MRVMPRGSPSRLKASPVGGVDRFEIRIFAKAICIVQLPVPVVINNMDNKLSRLVTGPTCSTMSHKGCKSFAATPLTPLELQFEGRGTCRIYLVQLLSEPYTHVPQGPGWKEYAKERLYACERMGKEPHGTGVCWRRSEVHMKRTKVLGRDMVKTVESTCSYIYIRGILIRL
jgi:hypothetical protein